MKKTRQPVESPAVRAIQDGRTFKLASPCLLIAKDGSSRPFDDSAAPIRNDKGQIAGVVLVFRDISQRRKTERALDTALAYADDLIATLREPFVVLAADLRVKTANRSFYDTFHVSKEETENRLVYDLGDGQWDIPALRTLLNEVLTHNQPVNAFEVEHSFPTLGRKMMLLNARPFPPNSKNPDTILLAIEDITERNLLEKQMREQTVELSDLHRRKDEFLAMLSHELRSPLAPISNAVQLLHLQKTEDRIQLQARAVIERQVSQLTHLVDELLEISRITTGRVQLRLERVGVSGIVERSIETARPIIDQREHELTVSLPPQPISLFADAARLEQVVVNLLTNAAKYTDVGGHIWLTVEEREGECVLRVRDTGVGIAPDLLPRIFDLFTQSAQSLDRSQGGLGIGLALVHRLVEMHHGKVEVRSNLGLGSEFVVRLPIVETPTPKPPATVDETAPAPHLRVLVVDDNVDAADSMTELLRASGHHVRTAYSGPTALEVAHDYKPDMMILDIGLPGLNGFEVAERIRRKPEFADLVLIAMTGYGQDSDRERSAAAGFNHHFVKPADFGKLQKIMATVSNKVDTAKSKE